MKKGSNVQRTNSSHPSLAQLMRDTLSEEDLLDLGLIANPIISKPVTTTNITQEQTVNAYNIDILKQSLEAYDDANNNGDLGIEYAGSLAAQEEVSPEELNRALDADDLSSIKEWLTPQSKRSNFWYVEKQYNPQLHYTRYLLANGNERIVHDSDIEYNSYFEYQRTLSDAWEEWDFDEYNKVKQEREQKQTTIYSSEVNPYEIEQCFIKVGGRLVWDAINIPMSILNKQDKKAMSSLKHKLAETLANDKIIIKDTKAIISYMDMMKSPIKKLIKRLQDKQIEIKIKLININNKTIAIL